MSDQILLDWAGGPGGHVQRRVRLLMLLDAADYAVIAPISTSRLHAFAFLADVLSPIYDLTSFAGHILKRRVGPYFPELQWELDRLVGFGMVDMLTLTPTIEETIAFVEAEFSLNRASAANVLTQVYDQHEFVRLREFFRELASALGQVPEKDLEATTQADVTWDTGHAGAIIDYAEWKLRNYSQLSAERLEHLAGKQVGVSRIDLSPGAKVNLYVRYLRRAANG